MVSEQSSKHRYNEGYRQEHLNRIAFPIGGIGSGMYAIEGTGAISHLSVRHQMEVFNEPTCFAAISIKDRPDLARVLEGPVPMWKAFGAPGTGTGMGGKTWGLPRYDECEFVARFPFAEIALRDHDVPLSVDLKAWNPFIPGDADNSSLPVGAIEYHFQNTSSDPVEAVFSFNSTNFLKVGSRGGSVRSIENGFVFSQDDSSGPSFQTDFAFYTDRPETVVDHGWFNGDWFTPLTLVWHIVETGQVVSCPPTDANVPGASLFVPFSLQPGESTTIRLMQSWYSPYTQLREGKEKDEGAFSCGPSHGQAYGQGAVQGYLGKGLVNTFDPLGDTMTGTLTSPAVKIKTDYIHFLIGGGHKPDTCCLNLVINGEVAQTATGDDTEHLKWASWEVTKYKGQEVVFQVVDREMGPWGHILLDHVIASNQPIEELLAGQGNELKGDADYELLADFEGSDWGDWVADPPLKKACCDSKTPTNQGYYYQPWYTTRFANVDAVARYWRDEFDNLKTKSETFSKAFYDTSLPAEIVEAIAANLTILKTPTILRQADGRLWGWEGCTDTCGCCYGSCTHVWNYAQALPHLFPSLERGFRQTEFGESMNPDSGRQIFRSALPIRPKCEGAVAMDGQLGGILKMYREWRISGDDQWIRVHWPLILKSVAFMIEQTDPHHRGLPEELQHNTYDINYFGPNCHIGGFYLAALQAVVEMGRYLEQDISFYAELLEKGRKRYETELFNGEYFIQKVVTEGLRDTPPKFDPEEQTCSFKKDLATKINQQGPFYQYGEGCLSDGVLGLWVARMCGLETPIIDPSKVASHLKSVYRYNFKSDLSNHVNPQRPTYAFGQEGGLLLCSWPHGNKLLLPFVYSDEVWTGIEYQVASHLMMMGMADEGLQIVRACRDRYDGRYRNPFNEYECGHWYARAMSSYGLIQGLTGLRYDAVTEGLYLEPKIDGDFSAFLSTEGGFGVAGIKQGKPFLEVRHGSIPVKQFFVNGQPISQP